MIRVWTLAFLLIAAGFAVGSQFSEPGLMASILWLTLAVFNEALDPHPWWRRRRNQFHRRGCCSTCGGTGRDVASPETNGLCWDCRATGHTHKLSWWNR